MCVPIAGDGVSPSLLCLVGDEVAEREPVQMVSVVDGRLSGVRCYRDVSWSVTLSLSGFVIVDSDTMAPPSASWAAGMRYAYL